MSETFGTELNGEAGQDGTVDMGTFDMEMGESMYTSSPWNNEDLEAWDQDVNLVVDETHDAAMGIVDSTEDGYNDGPTEAPDIVDLFAPDDHSSLAA